MRQKNGEAKQTLSRVYFYSLWTDSFKLQTKFLTKCIYSEFLYTYRCLLIDLINIAGEYFPLPVYYIAHELQTDGSSQSRLLQCRRQCCQSSSWCSQAGEKQESSPQWKSHDGCSLQSHCRLTSIQTPACLTKGSCGESSWKPQGQLFLCRIQHVLTHYSRGTCAIHMFLLHKYKCDI